MLFKRGQVIAHKKSKFVYKILEVRGAKGGKLIVEPFRDPTEGAPKNPPLEGEQNSGDFKPLDDGKGVPAPKKK